MTDYIRFLEVCLEGGQIAVVMDKRDYDALCTKAGFEFHSTRVGEPGLGIAEAFAVIQEEANSERGTTQ